MSQNRCDRCGRPIKDPNAKYGWRCAEIIAAGGSLIIDLSAIFAMLEKYADFSFESQNDLFDISELFEKMLTLSLAPYSMQVENDYVEKGAALAFAMFSNYDELGDKARKSAVSHFIEEMHKAEETLPPPSSRYTLAEQMNNKLIDYYEEENNPNTNDTVEDTIDELFGNIPLYHYLNAMFARTGAEFDDSLIKGIEGSLNAFMSLPYASSMMGDIAVVEPQIAFVPEPYVPQPEGVGTNYYAAKSVNWKNPDGSTWWPDNDGFVGTPSQTTLQPGTMIDRYGSDSGKFVAPIDTPYSARSLPPGSENSAFYTYEVLKPFDVNSGTSAPWFDQPGGGIQYQLPMSIRELRRYGYIKIIKK